MSIYPLDPVFRLPRPAQPATLTPLAGEAREILVIFSTGYQGSFVGETEVANEQPQVLCRDEDTTDVTNGATLVLHELLQDESGDYLTDESGGYLEAEGVASYRVMRVNRSGRGPVRLDLRTD